MPETKTKLTPLAAQKQLLVLESNLNRAEFIESIAEWKVELHRSKEQLAHIGSLAATAAKVAATVSTARRLFSRRTTDGKKSWLSLLFDGVTTGTSLWYLFRSKHNKPED